MASPAQPYLTTLTPLRGIAALLVVVFHSSLFLEPLVPAGSTHLIDRGWLWVDFFFILSGFILCYVYGKNFRRSVSFSNFKKYIGARFARVYPLHLVTLIWALIPTLLIVRMSKALDPFFAVIFNPKAFTSSLVMLQGMHLYRTPPLNTPSWSLSTEWWVYMIFPFLVPLFARLGNGGKLLVFFVIAAFYASLMYGIGPIAQPFPNGQPTLNLVSDFGFLRCLAGFLLGMLFHELYQTRLGYTFFKSDGAFLLSFAGILVAMHFGVHDLIIVALFPLLLLSASYNQSRVKRILDTKPLQRLGDWSFSIYMVHIPIVFLYYIYVVNQNPGYFSDIMAFFTKQPDFAKGWLLCSLLVIATLCIASVTYRFVELPCRNYLNRKRRPSSRKTFAKKEPAIISEEATIY